MSDGIIEIDSDIRLAPVVEWPIGEPPSDWPTIGTFVELGAINTVDAIRDLVLATYPRIQEGIIPTAFNGGFCLMSNTSVLIEPQCCGSLADLRSWDIAAALNLQKSQSADCLIGWIRLWIGHPQLVARPNGDSVLLSVDDDLDSAPPLPVGDGPFWNVRADALRRAVSEAANILDGVAPRLSRSLAGIIDERLRPSAVEWILHGTGMYQALSNRGDQTLQE
jgi:hypothetical protein